LGIDFKGELVATAYERKEINNDEKELRNAYTLGVSL
jgi:hypothetical protein